jgi:hypothetical protein
MLSRRSLLALPGALLALPALSQSEALPLFTAAQLLIGVERLAKLQLERGLLQTRAEQELQKERQRVESAARRLIDNPKWLQGLSARRQSQITAAADAASRFAAALPTSTQQLLGDSESLGVRLGFVTTALSGVSAQPQRAALLDLIARAGASALRVGKLNLAAAATRQPAEVRVSAQQALGEFSAALQAVGAQDLSDAQTRELQLIRHQWLLFSASLGSDGLVKDAARLGEIASTTDRMAGSLVEIARRAPV